MDTQIKETGVALARRFGWALEYNGGLELDGEFVDDADLSVEAAGPGGRVLYVLNISFADTTAYGFTLTREPVGGSSAFGAAVPAGGNALWVTGLPGEGAVTLAERYHLSLVQMREAVEAELASLGV